MFVDHFCRLLQPVPPCRFVAVGDDPKRKAFESVNATEGEDAVFPDAFERVAIDVVFALGGGV